MGESEIWGSSVKPSRSQGPVLFISKDDVPVRLTHMWRWVDGAVVIVSDAHFNMVRLVLNSLGSKVWNLMDGSLTIEEIISEVATEYREVSRERIEEGVARFLRELRQEWLVMTEEELCTYE